MTLKFSVDGMKCMGCVNTVKSALEALDGVQSAEVDLESASATIEGEADNAMVCAVLKDAGFPTSVAD